MPLFGRKKKDKKEEEGADIEAPEEDGLFMAQGSDAEAPAAAAPADGEATSDLVPDDDAPDLSVLDGGSEEAESAEAPVEAPAAEESNADDLLSAFEDDETYGDLADLVKDLEDVPMAELMEDLRQIRTTLPPDVIGTGEDVA